MSDNNSTFSKCLICFNDYDNEEDTLILKCNHKFHVDCIFDWLNENENNGCALCKKEVNMNTKNYHKLNFNTNKIIKFNYNTKYSVCAPVYKEDMHMCFDNIFTCKEIKKQLMNTIPAEYIKYDTNNIPIYILKSSDMEHYVYISSYLRTLLLFAPDNDQNKHVIQYLKAENRITYRDSFIDYYCINDTCEYNLGYINCLDYYTQICNMNEVLNYYISRNLSYCSLNNIESNNILNDMFMCNLKNLANTNNFIKMTTLSDTITQEDIDKYKKRIYHTISLITVYGYLNMCGAPDFILFNEYKYNINEDNLPDHEKYCHSLLLDFITAYTDREINSNNYQRIINMLANTFNDVNNNGNINIDIDIDNQIQLLSRDDYIEYAQILPSVNYMYNEIMPLYSLKSAQIIFKFTDMKPFIDSIKRIVNVIINLLVAFILLKIYNVINSYIYDVNIYNNTSIMNYIIIDNHIDIRKYRIINNMFLIELFIYMISIYIALEIIYMIFKTLNLYYYVAQKYINLTNVNFFNSLFKYDIKFSISFSLKIIFFILSPIYIYIISYYHFIILTTYDNINKQIKNKIIL